MATSALRIGIAGCGQAARIHVDRLLGQPDVQIVGCADSETGSARALADRIGAKTGKTPGVFAEVREVINLAPDALAIFTPHRLHYRQAMDALQAGVHVFIEKPLSTNAQEAADIVNLARGRQLKVGVGHQYRLRPSLIEAKKRLAAGAVGPLRLVTAVLSEPWLSQQQERGRGKLLAVRSEDGRRGLLADAGDHLVDALLWTTDRAPLEVFAAQSRLASGLDVVTAAAIRLDGDAAATLALSGVSSGRLFELNFFGERGRIHATDEILEIDAGGSTGVQRVDLPEPAETIDGNFLAAVRGLAPLSCPAEDALETVRLSEAVARSAASGEAIRLI